MAMLLVPASVVLDRVLLFHLIDHEVLLLSARSSFLQPKGRMDARLALVGRWAVASCWREDELGG